MATVIKKQNDLLQRVMWRFTIIVYVPLALAMMITYMPVKWLITGRYYMKPKDSKWLYKWGRKIF